MNTEKLKGVESVLSRIRKSNVVGDAEESPFTARRGLSDPVPRSVDKELPACSECLN
jgi:hypothetical protein